MLETHISIAFLIVNRESHFSHLPSIYCIAKLNLFSCALHFISKSHPLVKDHATILFLAESNFPIRQLH
jgi:hypothetical protein